MTDEVELISRSGLFDANWYAEQYLDGEGNQDPIVHYVRQGAAKGFQPHPLFFSSWYVDNQPDFRASGLTPLGHFVCIGEQRGARAHPLFDPGWYRAQSDELAEMSSGLFRHFLEQGWQVPLSPHPGLDNAFYDRVRPDVAASGMNRLTHFMLVGGPERIAPSPFFDTGYYLDRYPDVAASRQNPLVHYLLWGAAEGRRVHPDYDLACYQAAVPDCPANPADAFTYLAAHESADSFFDRGNLWIRNDRIARARALGLFDPATYLERNADLNLDIRAATRHFEEYGLNEGRVFTNPVVVSRRLVELADEVDTALLSWRQRATADAAGTSSRAMANELVRRGTRIGVFCSSLGNFFMHEIAELLAWGLNSLGIDAVLRNELDSRDEPFALRVFVAPHEFFTLGTGQAWAGLAAAPNSVIYNVEQMQTQWFCLALSHMLGAPLVLDINFQSAEVLRSAGCNAEFFMPGHLASATYAKPITDVSNIPLVRAYPFHKQRFDWTEQDHLEDRPIDILFIGSASPRRDRALKGLMGLVDQYRFLNVYTSQHAPLTTSTYKSTSTAINCALGQRSKIVLNIHRDTLGYFEWSRMVLQGFWQGACVVTDQNLPNPVYDPGVHFLEENVRHIGELIRWLLDTPDGRARLDGVRRSAYAQSQGPGSMEVALAPVLRGFLAMLPS